MKGLAAARALLERYPFCLLVNAEAEAYDTSRVPVLAATRGGEDGLVIRGHVARGNRHWRHWERPNSTLCVVTAPHTYVSPTIYGVQPAVPTWNHATASLRGCARLTHGREEKLELLLTTIERFEPRLLEARSEQVLQYYDSLLDHIVCFEIQVEAMNVVEKVSRHRGRADRDGITQFATETQGHEGALYAELLAWLEQRDGSG